MMKEIKELLLQIYDTPDVVTLEMGIKNLLMKYDNITPHKGYELTERDVVLITYGDQVYNSSELKLKTLNKLLSEKLKEEISIVHILPFYPFTSDDGFSVIDYYEVNEKLGNWRDIEIIGENFKLIFDAVINHSSQECVWFKKFLNDEESYANYYMEVDDLSAYSNAVRPRVSPLSHLYVSKSGTKEVWTTFSKDQVDLNFKNPKIFLQIVDLLLFYISRGAFIIRLDAVGFIWKERNTTCIHLHKTHLIIKVLRKIIEILNSSVLLLSETNVPHSKNISYFGEGDEAHMVYNFTLPPLLAFSILSGNTNIFSNWAQTLELDSPKTCYFNFLASHDGIGLGPLDQILNKEELNILINSAVVNGGTVSYKTSPDGEQSPYEINCNYFSLLKGESSNEELGIRRFIIAHAILLAMQGLPAIYFHSMFGLENDLEGMRKSGINRRINRQKLEYDNLILLLNKPNSRNFRILNKIKQIINIRQRESAFNPYCAFKYESPSKGIIGIVRTSDCRNNIIKAFFNLTDEKVNIPLNYPEKKIDLISKIYYQDNLELNSLDFAWLKLR